MKWGYISLGNAYTHSGRTPEEAAVSARKLVYSAHHGIRYCDSQAFTRGNIMIIGCLYVYHFPRSPV